MSDIAGRLQVLLAQEALNARKIETELEAQQAENARLLDCYKGSTYTVDVLIKDNARLREALKPFADLFNPEENVYLDMRLDAGFNPGIVVPMKHLRAARTALGEDNG